MHCVDLGESFQTHTWGNVHEERENIDGEKKMKNKLWEAEREKRSHGIEGVAHGAIDVVEVQVSKLEPQVAEEVESWA